MTTVYSNLPNKSSKRYFRKASKGFKNNYTVFISKDYVNNINGVSRLDTKHLKEIKPEYQIFMVQKYNSI